MKKIMLLTMTMVFTVALGVAYAGNQFTDIPGKTYDTTWDLNPVFGGNVRSGSVEGSSAGSLRAAAEIKLDKDFFSPTYDTTSTCCGVLMHRKRAEFAVDPWKVRMPAARGQRQRSSWTRISTARLMTRRPMCCRTREKYTGSQAHRQIYHETTGSRLQQSLLFF